MSGTNNKTKQQQRAGAIWLLSVLLAGFSTGLSGCRPDAQSQAGPAAIQSQGGGAPGDDGSSDDQSSLDDDNGSDNSDGSSDDDTSSDDASDDSNGGGDDNSSIDDDNGSDGDDGSSDGADDGSSDDGSCDGGGGDNDGDDSSSIDDDNGSDGDDGSSDDDASSDDNSDDGDGGGDDNSSGDDDNGSDGDDGSSDDDASSDDNSDDGNGGGDDNSSGDDDNGSDGDDGSSDGDDGSSDDTSNDGGDDDDDASSGDDDNGSDNDDGSSDGDDGSSDDNSDGDGGGDDDDASSDIDGTSDGDDGSSDGDDGSSDDNSNDGGDDDDDASSGDDDNGSDNDDGSSDGDDGSSDDNSDGDNGGDDDDDASSGDDDNGSDGDDGSSDGDDGSSDDNSDDTGGGGGGVGDKDSDDDGIPDDTEDDTTGTDKYDADTDDDGLLDGEEDQNQNGIVEGNETDARNKDTDGDALLDGLESGMGKIKSPDTDLAIFEPDTDTSSTTDPRLPDTDDDGLMDGTEDFDHNGSVDAVETDPNDWDTDDGTVPDGQEVADGTNPLWPLDDFTALGSGGCSVHGVNTTTVWGRMLALLSLLGVVLRRRRRGTAGVLALAVGATLVGGVSTAAAQDAGTRHIDLRNFRPGPGYNDVLNMESARVGEPDSFHIFAFGNYADTPFRLQSRYDGSTQDYPIIKNQYSLDLGAAYSFGSTTELGIVLPVVLSQRDNSTLGGAGFAGLSDIPASGMGDLEVTGKLILGQRDNMSLAAALPISFPSAQRSAFLGHNGLTVRPRLLGDYLVGTYGIRLLSNIGVVARTTESFLNVQQTMAFEYGAGTEFPIMGSDTVYGLATLVGSVGLGQTNVEERPLELLGGLRWAPQSQLRLTAGGGPGLTDGAGTPEYRAFLAVSWLGFRAPAAPIVVAQVEEPIDAPELEPVPEEPAPPAPEPKVVVNKETRRIELRETVHFEFDKARILPESFPLLNEVADVMAKHSEIERIRVEGHTDFVGDDNYNLDLSNRRAAAVREYLEGKGVDKPRMESEGFGEKQPIAENKTKEGRAKNRRVDVRILKLKEDASTGQQDK